MLGEKRIAVTTTLTLRDSYRDGSGSERRVFGTPYGEETRRMFEQMLRTAAAFHTAGVPLVVGTDCCQGAQIGDAPGKAADLVVLAGDPRRDFRVLHKPVAVLKAGRLVSGALPD